MEQTSRIEPPAAGSAAQPQPAAAPAPDAAPAQSPAATPREQPQRLLRGLVFTPAQNRLATGAISTVAFSVILLFAAGLTFGIVKFLGWVSPAVIPLATAFALSVLFRPFYEFLLKIFRNPLLTVTGMICIVAVPAVLACVMYGQAIVDQIAGFAETLPKIISGIGENLKASHPELANFAKTVGAPQGLQAFLENPQGFADYVAQGQIIDDYAGAMPGLSSAVRILFSTLLTLLFFVCFLTMPPVKGQAFMRCLPMLKESTAQFIAEQIDQFFDIVSGFFCRQVAICLLEGCLYGAGFRWIAGLPHGFLIGFALGTLNIVPFFGSAVGLAVALPMAFITMGEGGAACAGLVLAVWGAGQILDGWLITPVIQGNRTKLSYPAIIFSFLFWGTVFNTFLGMLLAIPMSAFCKVLWDSIRKKIKGFI